MDALPPSGRRTLWSPLRTRPYTAAAIVCMAVLAVFFCRRHDSEWEQVYLAAAARLWQGGDIYGGPANYVYPPFMAAAALPFLPVLSLPPPLPRLAWLSLNAVCLGALLRWAWRLAGGGRLEGAPAAGAGEHLAAVLGGLCGVFYLQNCLAHQQTDILIAAAVVGGCLLLQRRRPLSAATAFGLAAACKCTALLWAPYLVWRGRPLAALWLVVVVFAANLLPDLVTPAPGGRLWLNEYSSRVLQDLTRRRHYVGTWKSDPVYNQSLAGLGQRWCLTTWHWADDDCAVVSRPPLLGPVALRLCTYGVHAALLIAVLAVCGRPLRAVDGGRRHAAECGVVLLLMLLLSPMSSKAHFGTLVLPGFLVALAAVRSRDRFLGLLTVGSVLLALLSNKDALGERCYTLSLWYGVVTWQTLLLLAGCLLVRRRERVGGQGGVPCPAAEGGRQAA